MLQSLVCTKLMFVLTSRACVPACLLLWLLSLPAPPPPPPPPPPLLLLLLHVGDDGGRRADECWRL